jgi:N-acyl-D-amino-acid deacylase
MRFAVALDDPAKCPFLNTARIVALLAAPPGPVGHGPKASYYGCGWDVRPSGRSGHYTKWHGGMLAGTSALLVCREDGIDWAVLFNSDTAKDGKEFANLIDERLHKTADGIKEWPTVDLFSRL